MSQEVMMLHTNLVRKEVGGYDFLPGSPQRVDRIAKYLDDFHFVKENREHRTFAGYLEGELVLVVSTGMGGPSTSICLEELVELGAHTFIRVGTCASVSRGVGRGDVIIPTGAVRMEGTSMHFAPLEYPAIPDPEVNDALLHALHEKGYPGKRGVIITRDSFYTQNRAASKPIGYELVNKWNAYKMMGAIATEMEGSPLFIAGASLGVRTGVVLVCATDYEVESDEDKKTNKTYPMNFEARAIEVAIEAMRELILADRKK